MRMQSSQRSNSSEKLSTAPAPVQERDGSVPVARCNQYLIRSHFCPQNRQSTTPSRQYPTHPLFLQFRFGHHLRPHRYSGKFIFLHYRIGDVVLYLEYIAQLPTITAAAATTTRFATIPAPTARLTAKS
jgi:hypothetical protein